MARRRKRRIVSIPAEKGIAIAEKAGSPFHEVWIGQGYQLTDSCRFWERNDGSLTGRFIYRHPTDPDAGKVSVVVKGIHFH